MADEKDPRIITPLPSSMVQAIDDYRFEMRLPSRAEAIRRLIDLGMKASRTRIRDDGGPGLQFETTYRDATVAFQIAPDALATLCPTSPNRKSVLEWGRENLAFLAFVAIRTLDRAFEESGERSASKRKKGGGPIVLTASDFRLSWPPAA
jgi:hypothetical protein